jgi:hypothetical protein
MEETVNSILYGNLEVEIPQNLSLRQQLEVVRMITCNPSALSRIKIPKDIHPWVNMLITQMKHSNNVIVHK